MKIPKISAPIIVRIVMEINPAATKLEIVGIFSGKVVEIFADASEVIRFETGGELLSDESDRTIINPTPCKDCK